MAIIVMHSLIWNSVKLMKKALVLLSFVLCVSLAVPAVAFGAPHANRAEQPYCQNIGNAVAKMINEQIFPQFQLCLRNYKAIIDNSSAEQDQQAQNQDATNRGAQQQNGTCPGFTDTDNDGVCDNYGQYDCAHNSYSHNRDYGHHHGSGTGNGYAHGHQGR